MLAVEREWDSLIEEAHKMQGQEEYEKKYGGKNETLRDMLMDLLKRNLSHEDLRHLAAACRDVPVKEKDQTDFTRAVIELMVEVFVVSGDRDGLLTLLSARCPDHIGYRELTEYYLAAHGQKLTDPILILGEAFSACSVPEVRRHLAIIVHRGFQHSPVEGKDDAEFVCNAMRWYEESKGHLRVNKEYVPVEMLPIYDDDHLFRYTALPALFVEKPSIPK
jgi:hypothetical protein